MISTLRLPLAVLIFGASLLSTNSREVARGRPIEIVSVKMPAASREYQEEAPANLLAESRLVVVPTLVRDAEGALIAHLSATDFVVTDNGVGQSAFAEEVKHQPIALVVVLGRSGDEKNGRDIQSYQTLRMVLDALLRSTDGHEGDVRQGEIRDRIGDTGSNKVGLVTFGSEVGQVWNFPPRVDGLKYAFQGEVGGSSAGVAANHAVEQMEKSGKHGSGVTLDAVQCAMTMLRGEPTSYRHVILLVGRARDSGSKVGAETVLRELGEGNTTNYSLISDGVHPRSRRGGRPVRDLRHGSPDLSYQAALEGLREDTAATLAELSGGEWARMRDREDLKVKLAVLADDFAHSYSLSFRPRAGSGVQAGFHSLQVRLAGRRRGLVAARMSYWVDGSEAHSIP